METRAHHVIIGAFAIGIFLLAMGFVLWLSKSSIDQQFAYYDIVFNEAVTGLSKGGTVQYNGIKVGEVTQLSLAKDDPRKVIARIRLDSEVPVKQDTRAKLGLQGVTGVAFIQLSGGAPTSPPLKPTPQNPVPIIPSEESALSKLLASGSDIITSANDLLIRANQVLSQENVDRISKTLENLEGVTGTVNAQREDLGLALKQLSSATGELRKTLTTLDSMATTTNDLMKNNARQVLESTNKALASIDKLAN
jgi:phospholipid/cholesterol/gamma-HCH transport system substrate-binding protein